MGINVKIDELIKCCQNLLDRINLPTAYISQTYAHLARCGAYQA